MKKQFFKSKTVIGLGVAFLASMVEVWVGGNELTLTVILAGLSYAGYGFRDAMK